MVDIYYAADYDIYCRLIRHVIVSDISLMLMACAAMRAMIMRSALMAPR